MSLLANLQYRLLCRLWPRDPSAVHTQGAEKLDKFLAPLDPFFAGLDGLDVLDFGCGGGHETLALARSARTVVGLDVNRPLIEQARARAESVGAGNVEFTTQLDPDLRFDAVISLDAFEHFEDPAAMLATIHSQLKPGGVLLASFGPTWYHPYGGHLFSAFPWAHILLSEQALLRWRNRFRERPATRLREGMNGWSIAKFERMVRSSPFEVERFRCVPIRALRWLHCRLTRELATTVVQMKLKK